jgi:hypothetical protein
VVPRAHGVGEKRTRRVTILAEKPRAT